MDSTAVSTSHAAGLDPRLKNLPKILMGVGAVLGLIGVCSPSLRQQFAHSYLLAFTFFLSLCLGGLFLTLLHHLFDDGCKLSIRFALMFLHYGPNTFRNSSETLLIAAELKTH